MSGTSGLSIPRQAPALALPAPKIRLRSRPTGPVKYAMFDGNAMNIDAPVEVVLDELPQSAFDPRAEVELRLYRYSKGKSRSSRHPTPARWSALPHIEGGANAYQASNWLGSMPASGGTDRFSRIMISGLAPGSVVDATELARHWLRWGYANARTAPGVMAAAQIIRSTWAPNVFYASPSRGASRNIEPARFALAYVARDRESGFWARVSGFSKFLITNSQPPFVWDANHPNTVAPSPGAAGQRFWVANPSYDQAAATARITDSEFLAGWR